MCFSYYFARCEYEYFLLLVYTVFIATFQTGFTEALGSAIIDSIETECMICTCTAGVYSCNTVLTGPVVESEGTVRSESYYSPGL